MATFTQHTVSECPYVTTQSVLSGKWSILLLHHIEEGPIRFNEMHRRLTGISQATLTKQLRQLEEDGLIVRKVYAQVPPKVEYELSEIGQEFKMVLQQIEVFGDKYINFVKSKKSE
ncbi:TPA: winged helix-turn-helix transcriptional regulator [Streptococcus suis]|uniref:winged helix-turn-helix transcriptional regulator n=1 Tax=Streptococcus suis TaxID=1307 RepID=UPI000CF59112|nr:helix-turn-helix domain-containing protein [Streptococcus suis]MCE6986685.1 helix-turn-helix transcriptional regulator [Streptococcus suis]NQI45186.1 helix-turn-helix transcriptional regulator [Streptococcus suis]NQJ75600.1 helix-turn-helix transcriptional regulator [Streptococcus suis]NQJ79796.1 helix-turn-helix transcriptional regulator [Streptococcus suis]NQK11310.1 helix-turn-helix transcriptional regulator [Streptococcus suis]